VLPTAPRLRRLNHWRLEAMNNKCCCYDVLQFLGLLELLGFFGFIGLIGFIVLKTGITLMCEGQDLILQTLSSQAFP
jgi:hypothetical protein